MITGRYIDNNKIREIIIPPLPVMLKHQIADARQLVSKKRFCLFNEPGTGKTLTALHAWMALGTNPPKKLAIIVPPVAITNWVEWTLSIWRNRGMEGDLKIQVIRSSKARFEEYNDVLITSYGMFSSSKSAIAKYVREYRPSVLILDESHYLSSHETARTKSIYGLPPLPGIVEGVEYVWPLTGTPIRRYSDDLWPMLASVFPDVAKNYGVNKRYAFLHKFCTTQRYRLPGGRVADKTTGSKNTKLLNKIFFNEDNPIAEQRTLDTTKMPPLSFRNVDVEYVSNRHLDKLTEEARKVKSDGDTAELNPALAACWAHLGMAKAPSVSSYLDELLETTSGILVLFWHKEVANMLRNENTVTIDGATPPDKRQRYIDSFNNGDVPILLGQIAAMGVAINLQKGGRYVVFAERSWSPGENIQAYRRVWRMGQDHHVQVDTCLTNHFIDQIQSKLLARKQEGTSEILKEDTK